jgi:hypothetical protein
MGIVLWLATILALENTTPVEAVDEQAEALRLATAEVAERIPLPRPRGPVSLEVAPLDQRVTVRVPRDAAVIGGRVAALAGALCKNVVVKADRVELGCRSRRVDAALTREGGQLYLELYELRGLPWRTGTDGPPRVHYAPELVGAGGPCPGTTPAGRGECAFAEGKWLDAAQHFRTALGTPEKPFAFVRLGDLALIAADPATAIGWYQRAGYIGPFGRMATARLCELNAVCFRERPSLDSYPRDLPRPLADDLLLRRARVFAFLGETGKSMNVFAERFASHPDKTLCRGGGLELCRRLVLTGLRQARGRDSELGLEVYLGLPDRDRGALAVDLAQAAAEAAARLGAPIFGANLLSVVVPEVPVDGLGDHLARTAELYLAGRDSLRARVIVEFAESRVAQALGGPRWTAVRRGLSIQDLADGAPRPAATGESPATAAAAALAEALASSTRARELIEEIELAEAQKP